MPRFVSSILALAILFCIDVAAGDVVVTRNDVSLTFDSAEANFAPRIRTAGISGFLVYSSPLDACSSLVSQVISAGGSTCNSFLLAIRGNCSFDTKVLYAQEMGFSAVIVFDNEYSSSLLTMAGSSDDIKIYAVFVTRTTGETLAGYADDVNARVSIQPTYEDTIWSIVVFSCIAVLAIGAAVATCVIVRRHRNRHAGGGSSWHEPCGMSSRVVKAMPTVIYKSSGSQKAAQEVCAICLEDYLFGEKLRILPCCHRFHSSCVDTWLTVWQTLCPVCKHDARMDSPDYLPSDRTPLLSFSRNASCSGNAMSASCGSTGFGSPSESSAIQIPAAQSGFSDTPSSSQDTPYSSSHHMISCPGSPINGSPSTSPISSRYSTMAGSRTTPHANGFSYLGSSYSLEAFRASPFFTPPSLARNPSPAISGTYATSYLSDCSPSASSSSLPCGSRNKAFLHSSKTYG